VTFSTIHNGKRKKVVPAKRDPVAKVRKRIRKVGKKGIRWAQFRKQILGRDNHLCLCGRTAAHVHHKKKRSTHPELVFVASNCISLCGPCHRKEHAEDEPKWSAFA
jgi:5-methylcytosine-specific restriction endonuclease McrA